MEADQPRHATENRVSNKENMGDVVSTEVHEGLPMSDVNRNVDSSGRPALQPKRSGKDSVQNYLNEMAGEATGAMGATLGMMGGDYPKSYSEAVAGRGHGQQEQQEGQFQQQSDQESERSLEPRTSTPQKPHDEKEGQEGSIGDSEHATSIGWSLETRQPVEPEHHFQEHSLQEGRSFHSPWNVSRSSTQGTLRSRKHSKYEVEEIDATEANVIPSAQSASADEVGIPAESLDESEMARLMPDNQEIGEIRTDKIDSVDFPVGPVTTGTASSQPSALQELELQDQVPDVLQQPGPREDQASDVVARPDENQQQEEAGVSEFSVTSEKKGEIDVSAKPSHDQSGLPKSKSDEQEMAQVRMNSEKGDLPEGAQITGTAFSQPSALQELDLEDQVPDVLRQTGQREDQGNDMIARPDQNPQPQERVVSGSPEPPKKVGNVEVSANSHDQSDTARLRNDEQDSAEVHTGNLGIVEAPGGSLTTHTAPNQPSVLQELELQTQVPDVLQQPGPREDQARELAARPDEGQRKNSDETTVSGKESLKGNNSTGRKMGESENGEDLTPEARSEFAAPADINLGLESQRQPPSLQPDLKGAGNRAEEGSGSTEASRKKSKKKKTDKKEQGKHVELTSSGTSKPIQKNPISQQPAQAVPESQEQKSSKKKKGKKKQQQKLEPASDQGLPEHAKDIGLGQPSSGVTSESTVEKSEHPDFHIPLKSHEVNPLDDSGSKSLGQRTEPFTKKQQEDLGVPEFRSENELAATQETGTETPKSKSHGSNTTELPEIPEDRKQSAKESDDVLERMRLDKSLHLSPSDQEELGTLEDEQELLDTLPESERPQAPSVSQHGKSSDEDVNTLKLQKNAKVVVKQSSPLSEIIPRELAGSEFIQTVLSIPVANNTLASLEDLYTLTKELTPIPFRYGFSAVEMATSFSWLVGKFFLRPFFSPLHRVDHLLAHLLQRYVTPQRL